VPAWDGAVDLLMKQRMVWRVVGSGGVELHASDLCVLNPTSPLLSPEVEVRTIP
jgi:hypothetical protein